MELVFYFKCKLNKQNNNNQIKKIYSMFYLEKIIILKIQDNQIKNDI